VASGFTNTGRLLLATTLDFEADDLYLVLLDTAIADATAEDADTVDDIDANECTGTGYAQALLDNVAASANETTDVITIDCDDEVYSGADFGDVAQAFVAKAAAGFASKATTDPVIMYLDSADFPITTNGGDLTLAINAAGLATIT
jgi:hypothetical protein